MTAKTISRLVFAAIMLVFGFIALWTMEDKVIGHIWLVGCIVLAQLS